MLRRLFRDSSIYAFATAGSQGILFILFPFFAHVFRPRDYGAIDILGLLGVLVNLTIALEVSQGLGRYLNESESAEERSLYSSTALFFTLGCFLLFASATLPFAGFLAKVLLSSTVSPGLMRLAITSWWVSGILYLMQDQLRWRMRSGAFAGVTIVVTLAAAGTSALLVLGLHAGVTGAIAGQLAGACCGLIVTVLLSRGMYTLRFDWSRCRKMLGYSVPLIPASIGVFLNNYADRLALQHEGSLAQVGLYGAASRISLIAGLVLAGFQGGVMPVILADHAAPETRVNLAHLFRLFCALALGAIVLISVIDGPILSILAAPEYAGAAVIIPYVVVATLLGGMYMFAPGLYIAKRTDLLAALAVAAGALNVAIAFTTVPFLGIRGAAIASLVSSVVYFGAMMPLSQRFYHVPHHWPRLAAAAAFTAILVIVSQLPPLAGHETASGVTVLILRIGLLAVGAAGLSWLLIARSERALLQLYIRNRFTGPVNATVPPGGRP